MALTAEQRRILDERLPVHRIADGTEQPISVALSGSELRFLISSIAHYRDCQCSGGMGAECELMYWFESPQGHIDRACARSCDRLIDHLVAQIPERR